MVESKQNSFTKRPNVNGWKVVSTLGSGGNAVVKLVEGADGKQYAMKIQQPHASERASFVAATRAEVALVQELGIDDVPRYYEFNENAVWQKKNGDDVPCCYILMELVQGIELIDFFNNSRTVSRDDRLCRYIFNKVAIALHKLHSAGVAHRDIKPENVILTEDFKIKLIDLGYGIPLSGRDGSFLLKTRKGTPTYLAPELVAHKPYQGVDIDIFSFGVMALTLRTMRYPFEEACTARDDKYKNLMAYDSSQFWRSYA